jgi:hypothetical protein
VATRGFVPTAAFLIVAVPVGALAVLLALGQRDGVSLDRLLVAAIAQRIQPRHRVAAPEGVRPAPAWLTTRVASPAVGEHPVPQISPAPLRLPAQSVTEAGVVDLGSDGFALIAVCSTVNFALRTAAEQEALVGAFGRYLHSVNGPIQIIVRAERLDLTDQITELRQAAGGLPHPALERAAGEHADYLDQLRRNTDLLRRQVLLVLREPVGNPTPTDWPVERSRLASLLAKQRTNTEIDDATRHAAGTRLVRRLHEAVDLLGAAGVTVTVLDAGQATAVLAATCDPDSLVRPTTGLAGADDVITGVPATIDDADPAEDTYDEPADRDDVLDDFADDDLIARSPR